MIWSDEEAVRDLWNGLRTFQRLEPYRNNLGKLPDRQDQQEERDAMVKVRSAVQVLARAVEE